MLKLFQLLSPQAIFRFENPGSHFTSLCRENLVDSYVVLNLNSRFLVVLLFNITMSISNLGILQTKKHFKTLFMYDMPNNIQKVKLACNELISSRYYILRTAYFGV